MKKKLELHTVIILLCALGIAGSWIGIQIANDSRGEWSEAHELHFTTQDLLDLGPRSEVRCAGAVIGHVRKVTSGIAADGVPRFTIIAGVGREFSSWKFAPRGVVMSALVQSALSPSWINLDADATPSGVQARTPRDGKLPLLGLARGPSKIDLENISAQIDKVILGLTEPRKGSTKSTLEELAETVHHLDEVAASLEGKSLSAANDPAKSPPIEYILTKLHASADNLESATNSLKNTVGKGGELNHALVTLNESLLRFEQLTDESTKAITHLNLRVDSSVGKTNLLLDTLQGKADRLGETFVGRMLIAKPDKPAATPAPPKPPKKPGR